MGDPGRGESELMEVISQGGEAIGYVDPSGVTHLFEDPVKTLAKALQRGQACMIHERSAGWEVLKKGQFRRVKKLPDEENRINQD